MVRAVSVSLHPEWGFADFMLLDSLESKENATGLPTRGTLFPPVPMRAASVGATSRGPLYLPSFGWFSNRTG